MPKTPYHTRSGAHIAFTIHVPMDLTAWLDGVARQHGATRTAVVMQVLEDSRTLFELPKKIVSAIGKDADALELVPRDYLAYLLWARFKAVRAKGVGFDRDEVQETLALAESGED